MKVELYIDYDIPDDVVTECDNAVAEEVFERLHNVAHIEGVTGYSDIMEEMENVIWNILNDSTHFTKVFKPLVNHLVDKFKLVPEKIAEIHHWGCDALEDRYYDHSEEVAPLFKVTERLHDLALQKRREALLDNKRKDIIAARDAERTTHAPSGIS